MPSRRREQALLDALWERVAPLLPPRPPQPKGGRPLADDKACFAGIVFALRDAVRWNHLPPPFPSGVTCWRRHRGGTAAGVWDRVGGVVLEELAARRKPNTRELFLDATFAADRSGGPATAPRAAGTGSGSRS